jgi:ABC-type multidrug transport system fused ATPase/permease subunit
VECRREIVLYAYPLLAALRSEEGKAGRFAYSATAPQSIWRDAASIHEPAKEELARKDAVRRLSELATVTRRFSRPLPFLLFMAVPMLAMLASLVVFRVLLTSVVTTLFVSSLVVFTFMMFTFVMLACSGLGCAVRIPVIFGIALILVVASILFMSALPIGCLDVLFVCRRAFLGCWPCIVAAGTVEAGAVVNIRPVIDHCPINISIVDG